MTLGFYALITAFFDYLGGTSFSFHAVDTVFADVFGGLYVDNAGSDLRESLSDLPAFFTLVLVGVVLAWLGFKPRKPKPKFRKP